MKILKKMLALALAVFVLLAAAGCAGDSAYGEENGEKDPAGGNSEKKVEINVISREDGSGTRGAFIELFGIEGKDASGNKVDNTIDAAEITNSTSVMMTTVAGDELAIGYISLGSLNDTVKALSIDGTSPSAASVKDGSYKISRPFNIVTKGETSPAAQDFIRFILSVEGQAVVEQKGYIPMEGAKPYGGNKPAGKVVIAGSSSVTPLMEALKEAYEKINSGASLEIQQSDSTTGVNSVIEGISDIGMASREIKESEKEKGVEGTVIALDGIAVIVNKGNTVSNLAKDEVKGIYTGEIEDWSILR